MPSSILTLTKQLIRTPSESHDSQQLYMCIDRIQHLFSPYDNATVQKVVYNNKPSLLVANFEGKRADIVLNGHIDVVPADSPAQYEPRIEGDKLIGRGSGDMKAGIAIMIQLMQDILESRFQDKKVLLIITSDEETGGFDGVDALVQDGRGGDVVLIPDGGSTHEVVIAQKGLYMFEIQANGDACHSARPWLGENALHNLVNYYITLREELQNTQTVYYSEDHWGTSVNLNVVHGGSAMNAVPGIATGKIDIRFTERYDLATVQKKVIDNMPSFHCELVSELAGERFLLDIDSPHLARFRHITEAITGTNPILLKEHGGSDGRHFMPIGSDVIIMRPDCGDTHGQDEWVSISAIEQIYCIYKEFVLSG